MLSGVPQIGCTLRHRDWSAAEDDLVLREEQNLDYEPSVGAIVKALKPLWGNENSDPARVAQVVLRLAASGRLPAHLLLGSDAIQYAGRASLIQRIAQRNR